MPTRHRAGLLSLNGEPWRFFKSAAPDNPGSGEIFGRPTVIEVIVLSKLIAQLQYLFNDHKIFGVASNLVIQV